MNDTRHPGESDPILLFWTLGKLGRYQDTRREITGKGTI
jgi:hypothetical protein